MNRPDDILFTGAKIGKDAPADERRPRTPRPRQAKPSRPTPPPPQTDGQRREERETSTRNPYQERNNIAGTGDTRRARAQRRRDSMARRRESQRNAPMPGGAPAAPAQQAPAPTTSGGRRLREKPRRPRRAS